MQTGKSAAKLQNYSIFKHKSRRTDHNRLVNLNYNALSVIDPVVNDYLLWYLSVNHESRISIRIKNSSLHSFRCYLDTVLFTYPRL